MYIAIKVNDGRKSATSEFDHVDIFEELLQTEMTHFVLSHSQ